MLSCAKLSLPPDSLQITPTIFWSRKPDWEKQPLLVNDEQAQGQGRYLGLQIAEKVHFQKRVLLA
jgi:hypothetical protein